jgi:30S ribosomal protein S31
MGKGDQRSKRGKVHRGTFGVTRPKAKKKVAPPSVKKAAAKQAKA